MTYLLLLMTLLRLLTLGEDVHYCKTRFSAEIAVAFVIIFLLLPDCCRIFGGGGEDGVIMNSLIEAIVDLVLPSIRFKDFFYLLPIVGESGKIIDFLPTKLAILFLARTGLNDAPSQECFCTSV